MNPPETPKKPKSTKPRTSDPEPMEGLTPPKPGYVTPKKDDEDYSPAKEVNIGTALTREQKGEMAEIGSRQEQFEKAIKSAKGRGRKSRKHKKSKKSRKTHKVKKHGKRRH